MRQAKQRGVWILWLRVVAIALLWIPLSAINARVQAGTIYFDNEVGSDANDGSSRSLAKKTLTHLATLTLQPGDIVDLAAPPNAPYTQTLRPPTSGTIGSKITFRANSTKGCTFDPNSSSVTAVDRNGKNYIVLDGLTAKRCRVAVNADGAVGWDIINLTATQILGVNDCMVLLSNSSGCTLQGGRLLDTATVAAVRVGSSIDLTISGVEIDNIAGDGINGGNVTRLTIERCHVHDFAASGGGHEDGLSLWGSDITIRYNSIHKWTQNLYFPLFETGGASTNFVLNNLRIYGNEIFSGDYGNGDQFDGAPGIYIDSYNGTQGNHFATRTIGTVEIYANTFGYCGLPGIRGYAGNNTSGTKIFKARNNIFFKTRGTGTGNGAIDVQHGDGSAGWSTRDSDYNCFYQCAAPSFEGIHSATSDPLLVSYAGYPALSGDFRLLATSPCLNVGDASLASVVTLPSPYLDRSGRDRGSAPHDLGAYEYVSSAGGSGVRQRSTGVLSGWLAR